MKCIQCATYIFLIYIVQVRAFLSFDEIKDLVNEEIRSGYAKATIENGATYDFIVVGAGSAGSVVANRLSENSNWNVLLLEAGEEEDLISRVPILVTLLYFGQYNWHYLMEREEGVGWGLEDQKVGWPRGRGIGGTSIINFMIYTRGNPRDYDKWSEAGNSGWSYNDVLPYFLKSENASLLYADYNYHNTTGPLSVQDPFLAPIATAFVEGAQELGNRLVDYNSANQFGFATVQGNIRNGRRHTAGRAFVNTAKDRENLNVLTSARVTKILIDTNTSTAQGVEYSYGGQTYTAYASKEVIISAGTFHSPQLLMLSGIGPKQDLEKLEISVIKDLPVGKRLQDHICYTGLIFIADEEAVITAKDLLNPLNILNYLLTGDGPYGSIGGVQGLGYINTNISEEIGEYPDIELIFAALTFNVDFGITFYKNFRISDDYYNKFWAPYHGIPTFTILPMMLHPKSVGYLKLRSKNPYDPPLFYGNYYTDPDGDDMATMIAGIRYAIKLTQTEALQKYNVKLSPILVPGCEDYSEDSDEYWECAVRTFTASLHHQISTVKMGPEDDPYAIVDNQLKVYGVNNLRVADCSVIPSTVSAHTNGPALMIGEKVSDLIKSTWNGVK